MDNRNRIPFRVVIGLLLIGILIGWLSTTLLRPTPTEIVTPETFYAVRDSLNTNALSSNNVDAAKEYIRSCITPAIPDGYNVEDDFMFYLWESAWRWEVHFSYWCLVTDPCGNSFVLIFRTDDYEDTNTLRKMVRAEIPESDFPKIVVTTALLANEDAHFTLNIVQ